jgi:tetratricopeptide (TPR) repeat protein
VRENDSDTPRASFERAATFLRAGDSAMAEKICRRALNAFPRDANLLCLLGASLIKQERPRDAEHTLTRAVQLFNDFARAHEGLAEALIMQGKLDEALESLRRAESLEPGNESIHMKQAKVLTALGRDDDAAKQFEATFGLSPHREDLVRGLRLQRLGNLREAERIYRTVLLQAPDNVDALRLLAGIASRAKQWSDAEALLEKALAIAPDFFQGWMDLGLARQEQDDLDGALQAYDRAVRLEPGKPGGYAAAGTSLGMAGRHDEAIARFRQAIARDSAHAGALTGLGHVLKTIGNQAEAIDAYRACIRHNPGHGEAYWSLANLKTFRFDADEIAAMQAQLDNGNLSDESRANFQFALGKAAEDAGDFGRAFENYRAGNENRRSRENYDPVQTTDLHDEFIDVFGGDFLASRSGCGCDSRAPIFIVGLPRSGSTLIEQILASHPDVEGTHELPELGRVARSVGLKRSDRKIYPQAVRDLDVKEFARLGEDYLRRTERHRELGLPRFTDKLPNNFVHVGFISLVLPNARIIDARRHPLDSCLGSYKQLFARGQPFTYDLFELGEFYMQYVRLMEHWHAVLPGKVLEVHYEDVVADLEGQVRRLLDYCGLPWSDTCLRFWEAERAVKTASSEQVRRPIYSSSVDLWRNYESELGPLIEVLEPLLRRMPAERRPARLQD